MDLGFVREIFYTVGSFAGILAWIKPAFESKFNRNMERARYILDLIGEQPLLNLQHQTHNSTVPGSTFDSLERLLGDLHDNTENVRFSGPIAKHLRVEANNIVDAYRSLRDLVQVDMWEPQERNGETYWVFNRSAFDGKSRDYVKHLDECAERASVLIKKYQRLQIISELHFIEFPIARWLLPKRFKANKV